MNKLLQHLIDSGDVSHKVLPSLMKFQIRGEVPAGLKPIPRSGGDMMSGMKKPVIQMTAEEAKKRQLQMMAQKAVANQATVTSPLMTALPASREATIERNRQYAAATGKSFNPATGAVSPLLSDNTDRMMRRAQENIVNPMFEIEMALSGAGLVGQGLKAAGKYVVNNAALKNASKSVFPTFGQGNSNSGLGNFLMSRGIEINPVGIAADHSFGLVKGAVEQSKNLLGKLGVLKNPPASRSFFETFPVTKAQRAKVMTMQDEALADAKKFTDDYWYGNSLDVRPVLEEKMRNILPEFKMAKYDNNLERGNSPFGTVPDRLVRNTTWGKGREGLSEDMINYLNNNRGRIGGVNNDEASITLRNSGLYYKTPREIANTVAHESGHSAQNFGVRGDFDTSPYTISDYSKKTWGEQLAKFDPEYNYYTSNPDTEIGRRFQQALVSPKKSLSTNRVTRQTWRSSPNEVHSELMASKYNMYKQGLRQGYTPEQMMERVTNPGQKELEWLLDNKTINKHFKKGTSKEEKLALLKLLPAAVPAVAGASMLDEKAEGGEASDYKGTSIVDYLATRGYSGKKAFRKELASKYGVENYDYSATKNTELLNKMRENDDLLETYEQTAAPISAERLEQMYRANLEAKKQENYNNIRRRMALDMGYDPLAGQSQFEQAQYPELSLVPKSPYDKNSLVNGLQGSGRQPQPAPAAQRPANFQYVQPGKQSAQNNFQQFPGYPEQVAQPQKPVSLVSGPGNFQQFQLYSNRQVEGNKQVPLTSGPGNFQQFPAYPKQAPPAQKPISLVSGPGNFQQFPGYSQGVAPTPRPVSLASGPGNFQQFPAYPTRQVADLPKKTTAKAAAKALEEDIDEQNWFKQTWGSFLQSMQDSGLDWGAADISGSGFNSEGAKPIARDLTVGALGLFSKDKKIQAENYFKRQDLKNNDNLQETKTKFTVPKNIKSPDIVTGDTISMPFKNKVTDIPDRYIVPGQIDLTNTKWGYRNRDEYKDITTEGGDITLFNNLVSAKEFFKNNPDSKDTDSYIGLKPDGTPVAGNKKDFLNSDALISKVFSNKIVNFPRDANGKLLLKQASRKASSKHLSPVTTVLGDDGKISSGSLNFLIPKNNPDPNSFGDVTGGRVIFKAPDGKMRLALGSAENIAQIFDQFKKEGNYQYLTAFTNDNGTYGPGLRTRSGKITAEDLKKYQGANATGSVFMYLKPGDYNRGSAAKPKFKDVQMTTPNIRTEKDESFKKGHSLNNSQEAIVLHHTGYSDTTGVSKGMSAAMKGVADQFSKPGESSHVVIDFDGTRYNYARPDQVTFHAGKSMLRGKENVNDFGIGVEFQGDTGNKPLTDKQIESFIEYVAPLIKNKKIPLENIITHKQIRDEYMQTNKNDKDVKTKPDVADTDYQRIIAALKKRGIYKNGGPIIDPRGQWAHPGKRTMVPTPTGQITMQGVPYPVYGQDETGYGQMMMPGGEYSFPGQMVDETPMMQRGGSLPAYQIRGQVQRAATDNTRVAPKIDQFEIMKRVGKKTVKDQFNQALEFQEAWMESPMYKKMIQTSDPKNADAITARREEGLSYATARFNPFQLGNNTTGGFAQGTAITVNPAGLGTIGTLAHEVSHAADSWNDDFDGSRAIPNSDVNRINFYKTKNLKEYKKKQGKGFDQEWYDYVTEPTETRARLNTIRQGSHLNKLYDPLTQKVTPEIYKKLKDFRFEPTEAIGFDPLLQLRGVYSDQQIIDLLNSVSKNNSQAGMDQARYGGGLLSRSVSCSSCGHSWKSVDGGSDPLHCHKCGGMIKMQNGGNLPAYQMRGQVSDQMAEASTNMWGYPIEPNFVEAYPKSKKQSATKKQTVRQQPSVAPVKQTTDSRNEFSQLDWQRKLAQETAKLDNPLSIFQLMKKGYSKEMAEKVIRDFENPTTVGPASTTTPKGLNKRLYEQNRRGEILNSILKKADVVTDVMQLGNFSPELYGQTIGKIGNILGIGVDAFQVGMEARKGNYGNAAINLASVALPNFLASKTFRRNSKYLQPGQPLYFLKGNDRVKYIEPFTKVKGMTDKNLLANRALLGALGAETVYDSYKNGGQHGGLDRWFAEKWVDVKTGKDCGRQAGEKRAGYPACRPSKRVSSQTPKTSSEMSAAEKAKFKSSKTSSQRINYNHKRN